MGLPTTLDAIKDEELRLGRELPELVKSIILENNGGAECLAKGNDDEIWYLFSVKDTRSRKHASRSANHIERETNSAQNWIGFPKDAIALGENGSGDYLISLRDSHYIHIWRHENGKISETSIVLLS